MLLQNLNSSLGVEVIDWFLTVWFFSLESNRVAMARGSQKLERTSGSSERRRPRAASSSGAPPKRTGGAALNRYIYHLISGHYFSSYLTISFKNVTTY